MNALYDESQLDKLVNDMPLKQMSSYQPLIKSSSNSTMIASSDNLLPSLDFKRRSHSVSPKRRGTKQRKKPVRKQLYSHDIETFGERLQAMKKRALDLETKNMQLRTCKQRQDAKIVAKDREIEFILQQSMSDGDPKGLCSALMHEKTLVTFLQNKCKELNNHIEQQDSQLEQVKSQTRFSRMNELQIMAEEYYNEVLRLREFKELGREPDSNTKLSILSELKHLRIECEESRVDNNDLKRRIVDIGTKAERSEKYIQLRYDERIRKLEQQLRVEIAKSSALENMVDAPNEQRKRATSNYADTAKTTNNNQRQKALLLAQSQCPEDQMLKQNKVILNSETPISLIETNTSIKNLEEKVQCFRNIENESKEVFHTDNEYLPEQCIQSLSELHINEVTQSDDRTGNQNTTINVKSEVETEAAMQQAVKSQGELKKLQEIYEQTCHEVKEKTAEIFNVKKTLQQTEHELNIIKQCILKHHEGNNQKNFDQPIIDQKRNETGELNADEHKSLINDNEKAAVTAEKLSEKPTADTGSRKTSRKTSRHSLLGSKSLSTNEGKSNIDAKTETTNDDTQRRMSSKHIKKDKKNKKAKAKKDSTTKRHETADE